MNYYFIGNRKKMAVCQKYRQSKYIHTTLFLREQIHNKDHNDIYIIFYE